MSFKQQLTFRLIIGLHLFALENKFLVIVENVNLMSFKGKIY